MIDIIAQGCSIVGLVLIVLSFQCKSNKNFFLMQGSGGLFFFLNFILIGAFGGALLNLSNLFRGLLFSKNAKKPWKLIVVILTYTVSAVVAVILDPSVKQIVLFMIPYSALIIMSVLMWRGNPKTMRIFQIAYISPSWIVHNIFNLSIGGLICEVFNMISSGIYLYRVKRELNQK